MGWYKLAVPYGHPDFAKLKRCACGQQLDSARSAARRDERKAAVLDRLHSELAGLRGCTFDSFDTKRSFERLQWNGDWISPDEQRDLLYSAFLACREFADRLDGWLYLYGSYGAGKSHLAAAICHEAVERGKSVIYRSTPAVIDAVGSTYKRSSDLSSADIIRELVAVDLLVLDDLASEQLNEMAAGILFQILNERADRPTVLTSNLEPELLPGRLSTRLYRSEMLNMALLLASDYGVLRHQQQKQKLHGRP